MLVWNLNNEFAKVPYFKLGDMFTGVSLTFVFAAFLVSVNVHSHSKKQENKSDLESTNTCNDKVRN